ASFHPRYEIHGYQDAGRQRADVEDREHLRDDHHPFEARPADLEPREGGTRREAGLLRRVLGRDGEPPHAGGADEDLAAVRDAPETDRGRHRRTPAGRDLLPQPDRRVNGAPARSKLLPPNPAPPDF